MKYTCMQLSVKELAAIPVTELALLWLIITTTKHPYSEPLKDTVNCTVTESWTN